LHARGTELRAASRQFVPRHEPAGLCPGEDRIPGREAPRLAKIPA
jgi:hypothetical protein